MKVRITKLFADSPGIVPESGQAEYWDTDTPGLSLRVTSQGKRSWTCMYRFEGRQRRHTLGPYPSLGVKEARHQAAISFREVSLGIDPALKKKEAKVASTFGDLAELYLERYAKVLKRSWKEDERILNRDLLPRWKARKAKSITRRDVIEVLDAIADRGAGVMANRTRALVSKVFNFGIRRGVVELNPAYNVPNPGLEQRRERVLADEEIRTLWEETGREKPKVAAIVKLALLTAQRRSEIQGMTWDELDLDAGWWTIPAERVKNKRAHRVSLGPKAIEILRTLETKALGSPYVFRGPRGTPIRYMQNATERIRDRCGFDFRIHDLRRTAASHMTSLGVARLVVSKILNHVDRDITAVYDRHSYDAEKRKALLLWDRHVGKILEGKAKKVVALESAKAAR